MWICIYRDLEKRSQSIASKRSREYVYMLRTLINITVKLIIRLRAGFGLPGPKLYIATLARHQRHIHFRQSPIYSVLRTRTDIQTPEPIEELWLKCRFPLTHPLKMIAFSRETCRYPTPRAHTTLTLHDTLNSIHIHRKN